MLRNIPPMLDVHFGVPMLGAMLNTINTRLDARTIAYILGQGSTDIIISGGENISSLAVEAALVRHPSVALAAVVARPDEKWGETPCVFVELRSGASAAGKIQTYELRQRARDL